MSMRLRFAPSPTGFLHVGGARTALFNWLLAKRHGGTFVLRVEDTDRERSSEEMIAPILDGLTWLGLDWDEGPYFQSEGLERHRADADRLVAEGLAYRDFTTDAEAEADRERKSRGEVRRPERIRAESLSDGQAEARAAAGDPHAIRLRVPGGTTTWLDAVKGEIRFENDQMEDLVILRRDRTPTYNFAVVSDDVEMAITHVIRGDDHVSNTPKQIAVYRALGAPEPVFAHVPMILGADGKRLSKRHGATAVMEYARAGILPEAMVNFLALLGWSPGDDRELMSVDELTGLFSLDRVLVKSSVFDTKKLEWLNGQYIQRSSTDALAPKVAEALRAEWNVDPDASDVDPARYHDLIELLKPRGRTIRDMARQAVPFLSDLVEYDDQARRKHWKDPGAAAALLRTVEGSLSERPWEAEELEAGIRALAEQEGVGLGRVIHPLRLAVTGLGSSPGIFDVLTVLGRERTLDRLDRAITFLEGDQLDTVSPAT